MYRCCFCYLVFCACTHTQYTEQSINRILISPINPGSVFLNPRCWWLFYCAMSISATREASRIKARHLTPQYSYSTIVQYSRNQQASPPLHSLPKNQKAYMSSSQHHSSGINSPSIYSHIHTSHVTHQCQPLPLRNLISKSP